MDESQKQLIDKLKSSNNVLVTVGRDPSVDQLAALLGLTLFINKQGKHAAAVFSGEVPSTLEFLRPEDTIEKNTDSLRDFIIALDKSKADKLRYKVENDVVRIFITPYKASITQDDFEFSQGDFNVDLVVTLGVQSQDDLDEAIISHGRILHDATVASITTTPEGGIGTINWHAPGASSLSELVCGLVQSLDKNLLDEQISTAILTGIVAETDRFSNEKTTAQTMSASAALMAAGANQQLVASKLQESDGGFGGVDTSNDDKDPEGKDTPDDKPKDDGTLEIDHEKETSDDEDKPLIELPAPDEDAAEAATPDDNLEEAQPDTGGLSGGSKLITEPPTLGGTLTSSIHEEELDPSTDPFSLPKSEPPQLLSRKDDSLQPAAPPAPQPAAQAAPTEETPAPEPVLQPAPLDFQPPQPDAPAPITLNPAPASDDNQSDQGQYSTLADLEESINSPHTAPDAVNTGDDSAPTAAPEASLDAARDEVSRAITEATMAGNTAPEAIEALNAQPMTEGLHGNPTPPSGDPLTPPAPTPLSTQDDQQQTGPQVVDPTAPPPVPPPIPFQFGQQPPQQQ